MWSSLLDYMFNLACLNWSNLQECRFNRLFDPLTLWILTMQLNWYRCNLANPVPYMAAIASPCMTYLLALLVRLTIILPPLALSGLYSRFNVLCGQLYPSYLHGLIWLITALYGAFMTCLYALLWLYAVCPVALAVLLPLF